MKWSIVGLVVAGLVAALCAAVLVGALRLRRPSADSKVSEVSIVVAAKDLAAMSVVKATSVTKKTVLPSEAPKGWLSDPVQVVGRVLIVPMVEGQAFNIQCFASAGSGVHLASALPEGMRAFNISLTLYGGLQGLIYPGSVVDVLVSLRKPGDGGSQRGQLISKTLLQGVSVLAVEHRTVTSESKEDGASSTVMGRLRRLMVTLMLTPSQCQAIQLAQEYGTISLGLRNPLDASAATETPVALSELSDYWSPSPIRATIETAETEGPGWETVIIRGDTREKQILPLPAGEPIEQSE